MLLTFFYSATIFYSAVVMLFINDSIISVLFNITLLYI